MQIKEVQNYSNSVISLAIKKVKTFPNLDLMSFSSSYKEIFEQSEYYKYIDSLKTYYDFDFYLKYFYELHKLNEEQSKEYLLNRLSKESIFNSNDEKFHFKYKYLYIENYYKYFYFIINYQPKAKS